MNYIDLKNFRKYEQLFGDNGPAKIGHVNYVIKNTNEDIAKLQSFYFAGTTTSNTTVDWSLGNTQEYILTADTSFTLTNGQLGTTYTLLVKQTSPGQKDITWPSNVFWSTNNLPFYPPVSSVSADSTFNPGTGFNGEVKKTIVQPDGKIVCAGFFTSYDGNTANYIIRLNSDGSVDNTFNSGTGFDSAVEYLGIQSNGKIIAGGAFSSYDGNSVPGIVRINTDGTYDNTFSTTLISPIIGLSVQPDDKIIVFSLYASGTIVRLNSDGTTDGSFNPGTGFPFASNPRKAIFTSTGQMYVIGNFIDYDSNTVSNIVRINSDGSIDNTFVQGTGFDVQTEDLVIRPDGKLVVVGSFSSYDGNSANYIIILNSDGSVYLTPTFGNTNGTIYTVVVQPDNKMFIGGSFSEFDGDYTGGFCRLNSDLSFDTSYLINGGPGLVNSINIISSTKVIIAGNFTFVAGSNLNSIAQLVEGIIPMYIKHTFDYDGSVYIASR